MRSKFVVVQGNSNKQSYKYRNAQQQVKVVGLFKMEHDYTIVLNKVLANKTCKKTNKMAIKTKA